MYTAFEVQHHQRDDASAQPLTPQSLSMDVMARPYTYDSRTQFIQSLIISNDDVQVLERATRDQANSPLWSMARRGRLTASNFYRVYTKVQSIKKDPENPKVESLLATIMGYTRTTPNLAALKYGREMEDEAKKALFAEFSKEHEGARCEQVGLVLSEHKAYLGASPDAIFSCNCHATRQVVELKCPHSSKDTVPSPDTCVYLVNGCDGVTLKRKHAYYAQCQGQMALTGCKSCMFYAYSRHGSVRVNIEFDNEYWEGICAALDFFFEEYVAPELLTGKLKKEMDAVVESDTNQASSSSSSQTDTSTGTSSQAASLPSPAMCPKCAKPCLENCKKFSEGSVGCDACDKWYHFKCVGLKTWKQVERLPDSWKCPDCN
ncbi:uncharacterized protein LOC144868000 [Branchiostoma floridae x Branchiostoma japonicum]